MSFIDEIRRQRELANREMEGVQRNTQGIAAALQAAVENLARDRQLGQMEASGQRDETRLEREGEAAAENKRRFDLAEQQRGEQEDLATVGAAEALLGQGDYSGAMTVLDSLGDLDAKSPRISGAARAIRDGATIRAQKGAAAEERRIEAEKIATRRQQVEIDATRDASIAADMNARARLLEAENVARTAGADNEMKMAELDFKGFEAARGNTLEIRKAVLQAYGANVNQDPGPFFRTEQARAATDTMNDFVNSYGKFTLNQDDYDAAVAATRGISDPAAREFKRLDILTGRINEKGEFRSFLIRQKAQKYGYEDLQGQRLTPGELKGKRSANEDARLKAEAEVNVEEAVRVKDYASAFGTSVDVYFSETPGYIDAARESYAIPFANNKAHLSAYFKAAYEAYQNGEADHFVLPDLDSKGNPVIGQDGVMNIVTIPPSAMTPERYRVYASHGAMPAAVLNDMFNQVNGMSVGAAERGSTGRMVSGTAAAIGVGANAARAGMVAGPWGAALAGITAAAASYFGVGWLGQKASEAAADSPPPLQPRKAPPGVRFSEPQKTIFGPQPSEDSSLYPR